MIKKIDLFLPPLSQYQVLQAFTYSLCDALARTGIQARVLIAERENPQDFVDAILENSPDCTLSFNGLLPDDQGNFFCDMIGIPHVACLVDAPQHFIQLTQSKNNIVTCIDRYACDFFQGLNFQNALFMPHGVDRNYFVDPANKKNNDVVMLASFIDFEAIQNQWRKEKVLGKIWYEAAQRVLVERDLPIAEAVAQTMDDNLKRLVNIDPKKIDFLAVMDQIEDFVNGIDRLELIKALKDQKIELFGAGSERWKQALGSSANHVSVHGPVSFQQALKIMRESKIVLNSRPAVKNGAHERIFTGIASGAVVVTNDNLYMHENFKHEEDILFYRHGHWDQLSEAISKVLQDDAKRLEIVKKGQAVVKNGHTWDHRAATLVSELTPILHS